MVSKVLQCIGLKINEYFVLPKLKLLTMASIWLVNQMSKENVVFISSGVSNLMKKINIK
jgi:hypothetical protein